MFGWRIRTTQTTGAPHHLVLTTRCGAAEPGRHRFLQALMNLGDQLDDLASGAEATCCAQRSASRPPSMLDYLGHGLGLRRHQAAW